MNFIDVCTETLLVASRRLHHFAFSVCEIVLAVRILGRQITDLERDIRGLLKSLFRLSCDLFIRGKWRK